MYKPALALLVGLMLSVSGSALACVYSATFGPDYNTQVEAQQLLNKFQKGDILLPNGVFPELLDVSLPDGRAYSVSASQLSIKKALDVCSTAINSGFRCKFNPQIDAFQAIPTCADDYAKLNFLTMERVNLELAELVNLVMSSIGDTVYFDHNASIIRSGQPNRVLSKMAAFLRANADFEIIIEGHAGLVGSREYNLELGLLRATAVKNFLASAGVNENRIRVITYGEERPHKAGMDSENSWQNRRATIILDWRTGSLAKMARATLNHGTQIITDQSSQISPTQAASDKVFDVIKSLIQRQDRDACNTVEEFVAKTLEPIWHQLKVMCSLVSSDLAGARFGADMISASGVTDPIFDALVDYVLGDASDFDYSSLDIILHEEVSESKLYLYAALMEMAHLEVPLLLIQNAPKDAYRLLLNNLLYAAPAAREFLLCAEHGRWSSGSLEWESSTDEGWLRYAKDYGVSCNLTKPKNLRLAKKAGTDLPVMDNLNCEGDVNCILYVGMSKAFEDKIEIHLSTSDTSALELFERTIDGEEYLRNIAFAFLTGIVNGCNTGCTYIYKDMRGLYGNGLENTLSRLADSAFQNYVRVAPNYSLAKLAAEEAIKKGQRGADILGTIHGYGLGVPKNLQLAYQFFDADLKSGNYYARNHAELLCQSSISELGVPLAIDGYIGAESLEAFASLQAKFSELQNLKSNNGMEFHIGNLMDACRSKPFIHLVEKQSKFNVNVMTAHLSLNNTLLCDKATDEIGNWTDDIDLLDFVLEAKNRGLACGVGGSGKKESSPNTNSAGLRSNKLAAAQMNADTERQKRIQLEQELANLKAQQQKQQRIINNDTQIPLITIISTSSQGPQGTISGRVTDNTGVGEVRIDGKLVTLDGNGGFTANTYVPEGGVSVTVEAFDLAGLSSSMFVQLDRVVTQTAAITFDRLNPLGKQVKPNKDALALIVGVADYENTPAKAIFADSDALTFRDYASEKLGIPENRIKTLVDDGAGERELLLAVKSWITRSVKQEQSDVYVFFAGHGLASDDGSQMYLLPYDGAPELLEETTISREKLFTEVAAANPRSVNVFLDTCYSGQTRNEEMLIASRPLVLVPKQQAVPDNFTVMTAAAGDQTAKPLEEAKHGMFSYFLMKGMEGEADANQDNRITAGELHSYVQTNVIQQSSGSQTPELQGDADRVLVQFQ